MKVALVHDHLNQLGGAERVLRKMTELFPGAPIHTVVATPEVKNFYEGATVVPSFLQYFPAAQRRLKWYLPLIPVAVENFSLHSYDVVLSSVSGLAKGVISHPGSIHICYCHTPTRYLWSDTASYIGALPNNNLVKKVLAFFLHRLRQWDYAAAQRVDYFVANSRFVAERIRKYYNRDSTIIYPPVETKKVSVSYEPGEYFLSMGRLSAYKRVDLVIETFNRLRLPLVVLGKGPDEKRLKAMAGSTIRFVGGVDDAAKAKIIARAKAFIMPLVEDFGIVTVEAMAAGKPVIALAEGGSLEIVVPEKTGILYEDNSWEGLADAVVRFKPEQFDPAVLRKHAEQFDEEVFAKKMLTFVEKAYQEKQGSCRL